MRNCWEMAPEERPTSRRLCLSISKFIEHMADYMQMEYNPFTVGRVEEEEEQESGEEKKEEEEEGNEVEGEEKGKTNREKGDEGEEEEV